MPRPLWPPEYANVSMSTLLNDSVPHGAFRFYAKLRALSWGELTFTMNFDRMLELTGLSKTRGYEYARILRDHHGLLSYDVRSNVFECSFPGAEPIPGKREKLSPLPISNKQAVKIKTNQEGEGSRITGKRESGNLYPLAELLSEICHMPLQANKGRLMREAKLVAQLEPPPTPELLREHYNGRPDCFWRSSDWRGKKGENPTPHAIRETWGQWAFQQTNQASAELHRMGYVGPDGKPV